MWDDQNLYGKDILEGQLIVKCCWLLLIIIIIIIIIITIDYKNNNNNLPNKMNYQHIKDMYTKGASFLQKCKGIATITNHVHSSFYTIEISIGYFVQYAGILCKSLSL